MASRQNKRRSSTFVQRTNAHFKAIERQINVQPKFGSLVGDPPAITNQGKFIDRVVLVETSSDDLTLGAISTALKSTQVSGSGASGDFFITSIKIWGVPTTTAKNYVGAKFHIGTLTVSAGTQADPIVIRDYGTGSRRPGIRCSIPLPSSKLHNFDVLNSTVVAETTGADCIHVTVRQKL